MIRRAAKSPRRPSSPSCLVLAGQAPPRLALSGLGLALVAVVALVLGGCASTASGPAAPYAGWAQERLPMLETCRPEGASEDLLCGTLSVWEDRATESGRTIDLHVVVVPARTPEPLNDPVVYIAGGPGGASTDIAPFGVQFMGDLLASRDLMLVDQRGTGRSHPLNCDLGVDPADPASAYLESSFPLEKIRACRRELETKADLSLYTTSIAADDMDQVRSWLGYDALNLIGGSYGTRAAQEMVRRHPEAVRTATLLGLVGYDQRMPLHHASDGQRALDMILADCAADPACSEAFPAVEEDLWTVLAALEEAPGRATIPHPQTGEPVEMTVQQGTFAESLRSMLYQPITAIEVPLVLHHAARGDFEPFFRATLPWTLMINTQLSHGLYLSITCGEDTVHFTRQEAERQNAGTALGAYRSDAQLAACEEWVVADVPDSFRQPLESDVPILIVDGDYDPVTPPHWAEKAMEHLDNARMVLVPEGHHGFGGLENQECQQELVEEFIRAGSVEGLDASCVDTMTRPPFVTAEEDTQWGRQAAGQEPDTGGE